MVTALLTIMIWSAWLYKINNAFKLAETTLVATALANIVVIAVKSINDKAVTPLISGKYLILIPVILGIMLYSRYTKNHRYAARYPLAVLLGVGTGLGIRGAAETDLLKQIIASIMPLNSLDNIVMIATTILSFAFFFLTIEHKGVLKPLSTAGRIVLMVAFGAVFGNTILTRMVMMAGVVLQILQTFGLVA